MAASDTALLRGRRLGSAGPAAGATATCPVAAEGTR